MFADVMFTKADAAIATGIELELGFQWRTVFKFYGSLDHGNLFAQAKRDDLPFAGVFEIGGTMQLDDFFAWIHFDDERFKKAGTDHAIALAGMIAFGRNGSDAARFVSGVAERKDNVAIGRRAFHAGDATDANAAGRFEFQLIHQLGMNGRDGAG